MYDDVAVMLDEGHERTRGLLLSCSSHFVPVIAGSSRRGTDGVEPRVRKEITTIDPAIPVIMLTGTDDVALAAEALEGGAAIVVRKPFDMRSLERLVAEFVRNGGGTHTT